MEDLRLAEMASEGDVLLVGDGLIGKHHDEVFHPGVMDRLEGLGVHRPAHVDTADFRAKRRMT